MSFLKDMSKKTILHFLLFSLPLIILFCLIYFIGNEQEIFLFFKKIRISYPSLTIFLKFITEFGNPIFYIVYSIILLKGIKRHNFKLIYFSLIYLVVQILISFLGVRILKITLGRQRPEFGSAFTFFSFAAKNNSFPSGHTTEIYGATLPLVLKQKNILLTLSLGIFSALVGFSRIYLGKHHPSDVLAGYFLGSIAGYLIYILWRKKCKKHNMLTN